MEDQPRPEAVHILAEKNSTPKQVILVSLRCMTLGLRRPSPNTIVHAEEIVSGENCVVAIRQPPYQLAANLGPSILALEMRRQGI
jgi:hypothetical protein